jgi:hypothetical protein
MRATGLSLRELEAATDLATGYLYGRQLAWGEFETLASPDEDMASRCTFQSSPFATAQVMYSLGGLRSPPVQEMLARGLDFLQSEMEGAGLWRFWSSRSEWHRLLPPDVDDTCCASFVLETKGRPVPNNRALILANRNEAGLFFTWLVPRTDAATSASFAHHYVACLEEVLALSRFGEVDNVDCVVNANALLYLGQSQDSRRAVQHLIDAVVKGTEGGCSDFYPNPMAFYYAVSRAYRSGVRALGALAPSVSDRVTGRQCADGSFGNELSTALAICALVNFGSTTGAIQRAARFLLEAQADDGSWPRLSMFLGAGRYYGSRELTTAICVEALAKCCELTSGQTRLLQSV